MAGFGLDVWWYGSSYQTVIAIATARRVVALPATASQPLSLSALNATSVLRTVTLDFASQSLTCLSTTNLCVPVKVLTFMTASEKKAPVCKPGQVLHAINPHLRRRSTTATRRDPTPS